MLFAINYQYLDYYLKETKKKCMNILLFHATGPIEITSVMEKESAHQLDCAKELSDDLYLHQNLI